MNSAFSRETYLCDLSCETGVGQAWVRRQWWYREGDCWWWAIRYVRCAKIAESRIVGFISNRNDLGVFAGGHGLMDDILDRFCAH